MANIFDLTGTYVAANYRRVQPSTQFGTRILRFVTVELTGGPNLTTNQGNSDSSFSKAVIALQNFGEIWAVGTPTSTAFTVVMSSDTAQDADEGTNEIGGWGQAKADLAAALGSGTVDIYDQYLYGSDLDD